MDELLPEDLERIEGALRAELATAAAAAAPAFRPGPERSGGGDPLDEFFWREDEQAPGLPPALAVAAPPAPPLARAPSRAWLAFLLGGEAYAIAIEHVREILASPAITEVPRAPPHVVGVTMVRGQVVTVIDPRPRLGLPAAPPGRRGRVLVCEAEGEPFGFAVDAVSEVVRLAAPALEQRPGAGADGGGLVAAVGRDGERLLALLEPSTLVAPRAAEPRR